MALGLFTTEFLWLPASFSIRTTSYHNDIAYASNFHVVEKIENKFLFIIRLRTPSRIIAITKTSQTGTNTMEMCPFF